MLFSTIILAALTALTTAAPSPLTKRWPAGSTVLRPSSIAIYHNQNGAIDVNAPRGEISKNGYDGRDNTTLVTFDLAGQTLPKTCFLRFWLEPGSPASLISGSRQFDVFSSLQPAPATSTAGWGPGNKRDQALGRMQANYNGDATVLNFAPNRLSGFPCPKVGDANVQGTKVGYELVPVGDSDRIVWDGSVSGLYLNWGQ